jgi:hypothetical protein
MSMLVAFATILLLSPASDGPPTDGELGAMTDRGRDLAGYDRALSFANGSVLELRPVGRDIARQVARKTEKGWVVAFGRLDRSKGQFLITYEATERVPDHFTVARMDPPRASTGFEFRATLAMDTAFADFLRFSPERRPYTIAALPAADGRFWVYLLPAPTRPGLWPLGGDVRYLVAADGSQIIEKRPLHESILEVPPSKDGAGPATHRHTLRDSPEDTDVAHVLTREPRMAERVATPHAAFLIRQDGSIHRVSGP